MYIPSSEAGEIMKERERDKRDGEGEEEEGKEDERKKPGRDEMTRPKAGWPPGPSSSCHCH